MNTEIRKLRDTLIAVTNASPLAIEVKRLVFAEIYSVINTEADRAINEEKEKEKKEDEQKDTV